MSSIRGHKDKPTANERMQVIMTSVFKAGLGEHNEFMQRLSRAGLTAELLYHVNKDAAAADRIVAAIGNIESNPFTLSVDTLLERLKQANKEQGWGISDDVFRRLRATAPELPQGRLSFLSLKIRFGEGQPGVQKTFEEHVAEILRVHGIKKVWRWDYLRSDKKYLRLLAGNETHTPTIEWCVIDLDANRKRQSITAVRGPNSIADEGLVLAWLYPEYIRAINYKENPGFFLVGYELNVPGLGNGSWCSVPVVIRDLVTGEVYLYAYWYSYADSDCAGPVCRE